MVLLKNTLVGTLRTNRAGILIRSIASASAVSFLSVAVKWPQDAEARLLPLKVKLSWFSTRHDMCIRCRVELSATLDPSFKDIFIFTI